MTLDEAETLCRAIDAFDSTDAAQACRENNEPPTCLVCNGEYHITNYGDDPTAMDDACAHTTAREIARALLAVLPVVRAAEKWREHRPAYARDPSVDRDLERAIATMHAQFNPPTMQEAG